jgi:hypothetical protein
MYEFVTLKYGAVNSFPTKFAVAIDNNSKTSFPIFVVPGGKRPDFLAVKKRLERSFDNVDFPLNNSKKLFGMLAGERAMADFFESKTTYQSPVTLAQIVNSTISAFGKDVSYYPFRDDPLFVINRPIKTPHLAPMNEFIAIYCSMFFFGSLVRYRPDILEAMLSTSDAWLIERFIKAAPITFLRHARNLFDGNYLVYTPR